MIFSQCEGLSDTLIEKTRQALGNGSEPIKLEIFLHQLNSLLSYLDFLPMQSEIICTVYEKRLDWFLEISHGKTQTSWYGKISPAHVYRTLLLVQSCHMSDNLGSLSSMSGLWTTQYMCLGTQPTS